MKRFLIFFLGALPLMALDYRMTVKLDLEKKSLSGHEQIVWKNEQNAPAAFIAFHLYMNAFAGTETIFMKESGARHRGFSIVTEDLASFGYCRILRLSIDGQEALGRFRTMSQVPDGEKYGLYWPDEISERTPPDDTIGILELPAPLPPGGSVSIDLEFETKFPRVFARSGYYKSFIMGGQWYPKIAVFEGEKGWNCHFYHVNSEFFSDFADFDVTIDAPASHVVGATGSRQSESLQGGRRVSRFTASRVGDFAFTAWDKFRIAKDHWKKVELIFLHQPGNEGLVACQFKALKAALDACSRLTGCDYPYPNFTLVDVPFRAEGAGGMEYPMLVTTMSVPFLPQKVGLTDMTTVHEFIHNYFYGIIASNEFENAWMDEGITSYVTAYALEKILLPSQPPYPVSIGAYDGDVLSNSFYKGPEYPNKAAWEFLDGYSASSYSKPSVYLKTLENLVGEPKMRELFTAYFQRYAYRHPKPENFFEVVGEVAGPEYRDFIVKAFTSKARLDYVLVRATSVPMASRNRVTMDSKSGALRQEKGGKPGQYEITVVAGNMGDFSLPVKVAALLRNGQKQVFSWDGKGEWKRFEFTASSPLAAAIIDPDRVYVCDARLENNALTLVKRTGGILTRISAALSMAVAAMLGFLAF